MARLRSAFAPLAICLVLISVLPASGCNALDFMPMVMASKTLSEDFKTSNSPRIVIDTFNGSIDVSRGADGEVQVDVTKFASAFDQAAAEAALDSVQISMVQNDNTIEIQVRRLDRRPGNFGGSVVIAVPAASELVLDTSNGAIVCESIAGTIDADTSNGKLEIVDGHGPLKLETSNGSIEVEATDAVVNARTSNGRIVFHGTLADAEQKFKTSNSRIEIALPADAQFRFDGRTSNGRISCDFDINTNSGRKRRTDLEGTVGDHPNCSIVAATSNGSIALEKLSERRN